MEKQNEEAVEIVDLETVLVKTPISECVKISYDLKAEDGDDGLCTFSANKLDIDSESNSGDLIQNINDHGFDKNVVLVFEDINHSSLEILDSEGVHISQGKEDEKSTDNECVNSFPCTETEYLTAESSIKQGIESGPDKPKTRKLILGLRDGFTCQGDDMESIHARAVEYFSQKTFNTVIREPKQYYDKYGDRIIFGLKQTEWGFKQVSTADSQNLECLSDYRDQNAEDLDETDENDNVNCLDATDSSGKQNEDTIEAVYSEAESSISQDKCGDNCTCKRITNMVDLNLDAPGMVNIDDKVDTSGFMEKQNVEAEINSVLCMKFQGCVVLEKSFDRDRIDEAYDAKDFKICGGNNAFSTFVNCSDKFQAIEKQSGEIFEVEDTEAMCIKSHDGEGVEATFNLKRAKDGDDLVYTFSDSRFEF